MSILIIARFSREGNTTCFVLERFRSSGKPLNGSNHPSTGGNGSLIRLAPVPIYFAPNREKVRTYTVKSSRTIHAAALYIEALGIPLQR
jgi:ADP-ribosyl-[dinitrogen reductase] hydrolase